MLRTTLTFSAILLTAAPLAARPDEELKPLTVGDKAPAIDVAHWVKGEPVKSFGDGNIHVLEFWATWCGPCRASVPHLSERQQHWADYDVTIVGVSSEELQPVVAFMAKDHDEEKTWFDAMGYTIGVDPDRSVNLDYMLPSGNAGIPTAFIIGKEGRIEWIGHPRDEKFNEALEAVVRDRWDRAAFRETWEEQIGEKRAKLMPRYRIEKARAAGDYATVISQYDALIEQGEEQYRFAKFQTLAADMKRYDQAWTVAEQIIEKGHENAQELNRIAWYIVDDASLEQRNLDLALRAAKRANELTESKDPAILDTLARVHYEQGNLERAIEIQRKAVEHAKGTNFEEQIEAVLKEYEKESE